MPLLVVSRWSKHGYVSHRTHEYGSILHFMEALFHLPSLHTRDSVSDELGDRFDFKQVPSPFKPIKLTTLPARLANLATDTRPNDDY